MDNSQVNHLNFVYLKGVVNHIITQIATLCLVTYFTTKKKIIRRLFYVSERQRKRD